MSDSEHYPVIWVESSSESDDSAMYATCAADTIDLELSDNDEICVLINALAIEEDEAADRAERERAAADATHYQIVLPRGATTTANWATAGTAQIGGAHVLADVKRTKIKKRWPYYVVFIGRPTGVHTGWRDAHAATRGVRCNCLKGYATLIQAQAVFEYANHRGWIGPPDGGPPIPHILPIPLDAHGVIAPALTPLSPSDTHRHYYCVYRGQRPGIYASLIEAHLSSVGVPTSLHESVSSISVAREKYLKAVERHEIVHIAAPHE